jgi:selenophosphate synthase
MVANEQVDSFAWLVDPQTNGGLLFTFSEESEEEVARTMAERGQFYWVIGIAEARDFGSPVRVRIS